MIPIGPDDIALVALTTRALRSEHRPFTAREAWRVVQVGVLSSLASLDVATMEREGVLNGDEALRAVNLLARMPQVAALAEQWEHEGIWTLTAASENYPEHLRRRLHDQAPVVLHGVGDKSQLTDDGLGVVGSRNLTADGIAVAQEAGRLAARRQITLVSGGARGADREAMGAAVEAGGRSTAVLADSLRRATQDTLTRRLVLDGMACLVTPYHPDASFTAGTAMGRNKIIYGLSRTVLIVAADSAKGGTWSGALEAIKAGWTDVRVWRGPGEGAGNAALVEKGGTEVAEIGQLATERKVAHSHPNNEQLSLEL